MIGNLVMLIINFLISFFGLGIKVSSEIIGLYLGFSVLAMYAMIM